MYKNVEDYWVVIRRKQAYEAAYLLAKKTGDTLPPPPRDPYDIAWDEIFNVCT